MRLEGEQVLCRFHLSNYAQVGHQPLYERIVEAAQHLHLAGATVLKGLTGFSMGGPILRPKTWTLSHEVPVIVEIVDSHARIVRLLDHIRNDFRRGLITLERAHVIYYRTTKSATAPMPQLDEADHPENLRGATTMQLPEEGVLLRVFMGDSDRDASTGQLLYEMLVQRAHSMGLAGATVLHGAMGFGKHSRMHTAKLLDVSTDLPVVLEIVDTEARIRDFLPVVDGSVQEGLVTMEGVRVLKYGATEPPAR